MIRYLFFFSMNIIYTIKMKNIKKNKSYIQLNLVDKQSIRDFKKSGDLLKWIHNNGVMNLSVVIIYSIANSITHAFFVI